MFSVLSERIISIKEVDVKYKPILDYMKNHCIFRSMF